MNAATRDRGVLPPLLCYIRLLIALIGQYKKRYNNFIAQKYYNTKSSNRGRHKALMRFPCAEWCAWSSTESQRAAPQKFKAQRKEILMRSLLNLRDSLLSLFF